MGNTISDWPRIAWGQYYEAWFAEKAAAPNYMAPPTFDPNFGFEEERKERVMHATEEEMDAANLELHRRDYCAHLFIDYKKCLRDNLPCYWRCKARKHHYFECEYQDGLLRFKEYERERRLKLRALKLQGLDGNGNPIAVK